MPRRAGVRCGFNIAAMVYVLADAAAPRKNLRDPKLGQDPNVAEASPFNLRMSWLQSSSAKSRYSQKLDTWTMMMMTNGTGQALPYGCGICGTSFLNMRDWQKHVQRHAMKQRQCPQCNISLSTYQRLLTHIRYYHLPADNSSRGQYDCSFCGKRVMSSASLTKHLRTHTGERPYKCPYCNASKADKSNLVKHIRLHTKERPYRCPFCRRTFTDRSNFRLRHLPIHKEELCRLKCPTCGRGCAQKMNVECHMKKHQGWEFNKCPKCGMYARTFPKDDGCVWCYKSRNPTKQICNVDDDEVVNRERSGDLTEPAKKRRGPKPKKHDGKGKWSYRSLRPRRLARLSHVT
mmetsp:Transcript_24268/g.47383  ORF Transcript_24268/g.47383 Transcript_24268/m.47383 type:complete len:347 (+) Transcript_24268:41-1081(+)